MKSKRTIGRTTLTVCVSMVAVSCAGDEAATTPAVSTAAPATTVDEAPIEPAPSTLPATTTTATTTTLVPTTPAPVPTEPEVVDPATTDITGTSSDETIVVPFHTLDPGFPDGWTCDDAIPGFNVAFTNERGERNIVEARFNNLSRPAPADSNAACAVEPFEGATALYVTAQLIVPAAETYQLIEIRYPFANGAGNDRYNTVVEMVTAEQAQIGIYLGDELLDPSDAADLPFPVVD